MKQLAQETKKRVSLTMEEAIQIALVENLALQNVRLDMDNANAQIKEGWAELYPKLDINASYTRNVRSAKPLRRDLMQAGCLKHLVS